VDTWRSARCVSGFSSIASSRSTWADSSTFF
jgi:hypothetical protein